MNIFTLLLPKTICSQESELNGKITVVEGFGSTKLIFGGGVQSLKYNSRNIEKQYWGITSKFIIEKLSALINLDPNYCPSLLVVGLGGGTIQYIVAKNISNVRITSVELDKCVADLANKYFDLDQIPKHNLVIADAYKFAENPTKHQEDSLYDFVLIDIHEGDLFSELPDEKFLENMKKLCKQNGLLAINFIVSKKDNTKLTDLVELMGRYFDRVDCLRIKNKALADNILVYGYV